MILSISSVIWKDGSSTWVFLLGRSIPNDSELFIGTKLQLSFKFILVSNKKESYVLAFDSCEVADQIEVSNERVQMTLPEIFLKGNTEISKRYRNNMLQQAYIYGTLNWNEEFEAKSFNVSEIIKVN